MDKQEVINEIEKIDYQNLKYNSPERMLSAQKQLIIDIIERLDEPQKVKVKQFVAEWYEEHKHNLSNSLWEFTAELNEKTLVTGAIYTEFESWFIEHPRAYEFITSMGKGYEVEEEPKWVVKYKPGNLENNWYFIGFCGGDRTLQPNCASHIDCDTVIKFKDRSKAEAVATLIDGSVEEV